MSTDQNSLFRDRETCLYADDTTSYMEYERHVDSYWDPFAEIFNVTAPGSS